MYVYVGIYVCYARARARVWYNLHIKYKYKISWNINIIHKSYCNNKNKNTKSSLFEAERTVPLFHGRRSLLAWSPNHCLSSDPIKHNHMGFAWVNCSKSPIAHDGGRRFAEEALWRDWEPDGDVKVGSVRWGKLLKEHPTPDGGGGGEVVAPSSKMEHTLGEHCQAGGRVDVYLPSHTARPLLLCPAGTWRVGDEPTRPPDVRPMSCPYFSRYLVFEWECWRLRACLRSKDHGEMRECKG